LFKMRRLNIFILFYKILGIAPKEEGGVTFNIRELNIAAFIFLKYFYNLRCPVQYRELKDLRPVYSLAYLTFPCLIDHAFFTEFDQFSGTGSLTIRHKINKSKVNKVKHCQTTKNQ